MTDIIHGCMFLEEGFPPTAVSHECLYLSAMRRVCRGACLAFIPVSCLFPFHSTYMFAQATFHTQIFLPHAEYHEWRLLLLYLDQANIPFWLLSPSFGIRCDASRSFCVAEHAIKGLLKYRPRLHRGMPCGSNGLHTT